MLREHLGDAFSKRYWGAPTKARSDVPPVKRKWSKKPVKISPTPHGEQACADEGRRHRHIDHALSHSNGDLLYEISGGRGLLIAHQERLTRG